MKPLSLLLSLLLACSAQARPVKVYPFYPATLESVHDGDTITVRIGGDLRKIRLAEIDAPELAQPWGLKSRDFLKQTLQNRPLYILDMGKDKYGRILAHVNLMLEKKTDTTTTHTNEDVNLTMVQDGMAWCYQGYSKDTRFIEAETQAKQEHLGLWSDSKPQAPWIYRNQKKHTLVKDYYVPGYGYYEGCIGNDFGCYVYKVSPRGLNGRGCRPANDLIYLRHKLPGVPDIDQVKQIQNEWCPGQEP